MKNWLWLWKWEPHLRGGTLKISPLLGLLYGLLAVGLVWVGVPLWVVLIPFAVFAVFAGIIIAFVLLILLVFFGFWLAGETFSVKNRYGQKIGHLRRFTFTKY